MNRRIAAGVMAIAASAILLTGCTKQADDVNKNLSKDADNFKISRRVTFVNGITDKTMLEITGKCSVDMSDPARYGVTCKDDNGNYLKHLLGKSDNVTCVVEQVEPSDTSASHYHFILRPGALVPDLTVSSAK